MKATTTLHHYRQHPILVIKHQNHAGTYYTATNEANDGYLSDYASDDDKNKDAETTVHAYATEAGALAAQHAEIEEVIGPAEDNEITEAASDLAHALRRDDAEQNAKRLEQVLASYTEKNGGSAESALAALVKGLKA